MRAASLFGVFLIARILILAGRNVPFSAWTPIAYVWQDVRFCLLFAALESVFRRSRMMWMVYAALVAYVAVNVPVVRVVSSPLTWPMLRAARGPLADSITYHLTPANLGCAAVVAGVGAFLPFALGRWGARPGDASILAGAMIVVAGPTAASRIETVGLERNFLIALVETALPRLPARPSDRDWRASPFDTPATEDLSQYRGSAGGRNVVLVALESAGARYLRPYGAAEDPMPNLTSLAGAVLESDDVAVELVCDGVHVHPAMMRVAFATKGASKVMAITDGTAGAGLPAGSHSVIGGRRISVGDAALLDDGTIAGSVLTMDRAFARLVRSIGLTLIDAAMVCSTTPARELRLHGLGVIAPGARADLLIVEGNPLEDLAVLTDPEHHMQLVMQGGATKFDRLGV